MYIHLSIFIHILYFNKFFSTTAMYFNVFLMLFVPPLIMGEMMVEVIPGSYLTEIENMVIYEKSLPLKFLVEYTFPEKSSNQTSWICRNCELLHSLQKLENAIDNQLMETQFEGNNIRFKRGIQAFGDFLRFCCNVATTEEIYPLYDNDENIVKSYNNLKNELLETHSLLLNVSTRLNLFKDKIYSNFAQIYTAIDEINNNKIFTIPLIANIIGKMYYNSYFSSILTHCKEHKLPSSLVPPELLKMNLETLERNIKTKNYMLAIPISSLVKYYSISVSNCQISSKHILIEVKIPIIKTNRNWKLFKHTPVHFSHENELCILNNEQMLIAVDYIQNNIRELSGPSLKYCDLDKNMCFLDLFDSAYESPECAKSLLLSKNLISLNKVCSFRCEPKHTKTIIRKVSQNNYIISNPQNSLILHDAIKNQTIPTEIDYENPGAIKLTIPCHFELHQITNDEKQILIPQDFPCSINQPEDLIISRIVPLQWSNLDFGTLEFNTRNPFKFHNLSKVFNENWKINTPHFDIKRSTLDLKEKLDNLIIHKTPPYLSTPWYGNLIILIWLITLTLIEITSVILVFKIILLK